jgi:outer membrane protein TolC
MRQCSGIISGWRLTSIIKVIYSAQKKMQVYQKAIDQATENYRITKNKYDNSLATTTDLLDANVAQLLARLNLFQRCRRCRWLLTINYCKAAGILNNK